MNLNAVLLQTETQHPQHQMLRTGTWCTERPSIMTRAKNYPALQYPREPSRHSTPWPRRDDATTCNHGAWHAVVLWLEWPAFPASSQGLCVTHADKVRRPQHGGTKRMTCSLINGVTDTYPTILIFVPPASCRSGPAARLQAARPPAAPCLPAGAARGLLRGQGRQGGHGAAGQGVAGGERGTALGRATK